MKVKKFIKEQIVKIKNEVGSKKAVVACSGGVDSSVCTILAHRALHKNLLAVFIDDGLMREGEPEQVVQLFRNFGVRIKSLRTQKRFFKALKGRVDPEMKRKTFRHLFYQILGEVVKKEKAKFLIQGTIKADIDETKGGIKTQHNVLEQIGVDPEKFGLKIMEPLKDLYKPDVRLVAENLGLPKEIYERMPFPGPGLATRIIGEVTPKKAKLVRQATAIVEEELKKFPSFQVFAILLSDKATGVKKGRRTFGQIIVIRAIDSKDALTASVTKIPQKKLRRIQEIIVTEIPEVNRVLYDLTPKPPATIEYI